MENESKALHKDLPYAGRKLASKVLTLGTGGDN